MCDQIGKVSATSGNRNAAFLLIWLAEMVGRVSVLFESFV